MLSHTQAYLNLRRQAQEAINFVVLVCHSVPALNGYMKAVERNEAKKLPDTDYFNVTQPHDKLRKFKESYKKTLGRSVIISSFAYFEAYIKDVFVEIIQFHGGSQVIAVEQRRELVALQPVIQESKKKLSDQVNAAKAQKYRKHIENLHKVGYPLPTDLFATYGIHRLEGEIKELRSVNIPTILEHALCLSLDEEKIKEFHRIREIRNQIAHGLLHELDLSLAMDANGFLRKLARTIDAHIVQNFLLIDKNTLRGRVKK